MLKLSLIQFTAFSQSGSCVLQAISASAAWYGAIDVRIAQLPCYSGGSPRTSAR